MINYVNLRKFAYSNDKLIKGEIKGIVIHFMGLGYNGMIDEDCEEGKFFSERDLVYIVPYLNPWAWLNRAAVEKTDMIVSSVISHYGLGEIPVCSTGLSMGGQQALAYCYYSPFNITSCVTNCPVCDMVFHFDERPDLPRTIYDAYYYADDFEKELESRSPYHLSEKLPRIPYVIFHCEEDRQVNIDLHSVKFIEIMRQTGHDMKLIRVPGRGHVDLGPEYKAKYLEKIADFFK